jgi:drug/metabolite transporter (DMT)-like permease
MSSGSGRAVAPSLLLVGAAACWGIATVVSKRAIDEIDPLVLLPVELAVSVVALAGVIALSPTGSFHVDGAGRLMALGVLNPGLSYALSLAGLVRVTAGTSVLLWALEPILILALGWLVLRHRVPWTVAGCAVVALAGVLLVVADGGANADGIGVALTLAGVVACAVYSVLAGGVVGEQSTLAAVFVQQVAALVFAFGLLLAVGLVEPPDPVSGVSAQGWLSAVSAGLLYYAIAFCLYLAGLRRRGPGFAGLFISLVPVFGIVGGALMLDERLSMRHWVGSAVVVVAVTAAGWLQHRRPAPGS